MPQGPAINVAATANGAVVSASSTYSSQYPVSEINDGDRAGTWGSGNYGCWADATGGSLPDWIQVDFNNTHTIGEVDFFSLQDNYQNPVTPTESMTFTTYGNQAFDVQYWTGNAWATVSGGSITGNNKVWRKVTFTPVTTNKLRVVINQAASGYTYVTEVEAWTVSGGENVAATVNGGTAHASSIHSSQYPVSEVNDGDRAGTWGSGNYGCWADATGGSLPDWVQVDFNNTYTIGEVDFFSLQDNYQNPVMPTESMTFTTYGNQAFDVQYWTGNAWATVSGGSITGNNKVWRKVTFTPVTTNKIRVGINQTASSYSYVTEVGAWTASAASNGSTPSDFAMARLDPRNRTGTGGEDLLSNNFNWSRPLVGLPGRSRLDSGLTLSYNSLVWTRSGNAIDFDIDDGSIAPGFRLGFPTIEGPYWNPDASANFYLLVTPSGGRVELRQIGTSVVYEAKDSSYLQLTDNLNGTMTLRPTDGSQMNFIGVSGAWRCNQIKDRNGNFINVTYKSWGEIETVTDTLNRVLTFNYDGNDNLQSITQAGRAQPWATFGWGTAPIGINFPSLTNLGPNSTTIPVLTQVGLPDGSRYNFEYNNSYGMVSTIRHFAADPGNPNHERNHVTYVYSADGSDCPRITQRNDAAEYWTGFNGVPNGVVTQFAQDADGACRMTAPDGTVYKEYYAGSAGVPPAPAWQNGLVLQSEVWSAGVRQKWTTTSWTQDNTSVSYLTNPRVTETNVYDASGNRRRTTIDYGAYSQWGLPYIAKEYAGDGTTELRRSQTDYHLTQTYLDRRIIGLVSGSQLYDAVAAQWQAKVTYSYDATAINSQATTATMHDQSYNSTFTVRGNATSVSRWDVTDINNASKALSSTMSYNAAGSVVSTTDPAGHTNSVSYTDSFSDGNNSRNTFAYPTTVTDADGLSTTLQYNFDFGARTRGEGPPPQNQSNGVIQTFAYDDAARLDRVTTANTGGYTRYIYGPNYVITLSSINFVGDEAYSDAAFDGPGRLIASATRHPGSAGGYSAQLTYRDMMGRVMKQSNPTEINSSWVPSGDDAAGWNYTKQTYDWQGRPLETTHEADGTVKYASYAGCGCAGGEVVTLTDEVGRRQKVYSDVLGRQWKSEILNWDGAVYSTTTNTLNARDQVTLIRQWAGAENGGGSYQDTTMSYDGYGRLQSKHVPEQNAGAATVFAYNPDDTIQSVTDARGASATYGYNNHRHLVTSINYNAPSGITPTPNVTFGYDAAGNRTSMTDGLGTRSYVYNQLSQMTSETRTFAGLGNFMLSYDYNLAGQLKSITDPANSRVDYGFDSAGRLNNITGTNYGISQFLTSASHRASGAVKQAAYGNGRTLSMTYDTRLRVSHLEMPGVMNFDYQFYNDGSLKYSHDVLDQRFDRAYEYDHVGRLTKGLSGAEARYEAPTGDRPYYQTYTRDAIDHLTNRITKHWSKNTPYVSVDSYTNNRRDGWSYDADGNLTNNISRQYGYDAAGQISFVSGSSLNQYFDGDGQRVKTVEPNLTTYYIRSTVLSGQVIAEVDGSGTRQRGFIYQGTKLLAEQWQNGSVVFVFADASGKSIRYTDSQSGTAFIFNELDPAGAEAEREDPYPAEPEYTGRAEGGALFPGFGNITDPSRGCTSNGIFGPCDWGFNPGGGVNTSFWGYQIGDLPGFGTNWGSFAAQAEQRYMSLGQGFDPAFNRLIGTATVTVNGVVVQTIQNPTVDQYQQLETAYLPDSGTVDLETNTVTIFGGAAYFTAPQNSSQQQPSPKGFPCPPTGDDLAKNPYIDQAFQAANRYARSGDRGYVEAGGWILMDRKGNLKYFVKPREVRDYSIRIYGLGEPEKYIRNYKRGGDIVVADFHTHVDEMSNPDEVGIANARGIPGIWVYPSGRAEAYGPNRGLHGRKLPKGCK